MYLYSLSIEIYVVCIELGPWWERGLASCLHLIYLSLHCEIKLDINLLSKTNKYKSKQTNQKYQKERKKPTWMHLSSIWLSPVHISVPNLLFRWSSNIKCNTCSLGLQALQSQRIPDILQYRTLYFKIMVPNSNFSKTSSDIRIIIW
jgi:hypothetical protein